MFISERAESKAVPYCREAGVNPQLLWDFTVREQSPRKGGRNSFFLLLFFVQMTWRPSVGVPLRRKP